MLTENETSDKCPSAVGKVDMRPFNEYKWTGTRVFAVLFKVESDGEVYLKIQGRNALGSETGELVIPWAITNDKDMEIFDYVSD